MSKIKIEPFERTREKILIGDILEIRGREELIDLISKEYTMTLRRDEFGILYTMYHNIELLCGNIIHTLTYRNSSKLYEDDKRLSEVNL